MWYADISREFTAKLKEYLDGGWTVDLGSCVRLGSGQYSVDLADGNRALIRIAIEDYDECSSGLRGLALKVGGISGTSANGERFLTCRNGSYEKGRNFEIFYAKAFYRIGISHSNHQPYFTTDRDEAIAARTVRLNRDRAFRESGVPPVPLKRPGKGKAVKTQFVPVFHEYRRVGYFQNNGHSYWPQSSEALALARSYISRKTGLKPKAIARQRIGIFKPAKDYGIGVPYLICLDGLPV